jgi:hypothetical protein
MRIDHERREVHLKVTYFGPGLAGKQTCIAYVSNKTPPHAKSKLHNVFNYDDTGRQVWVELTPSTVPPIAGHTVKLHLHTNSGGLWSETTRRVSLEGADGVMFVARSDLTGEDANIEAMKSLTRLLAAGVARTPDIPRALCYNKRDCPGEKFTVAELDRELNRAGRPSFETVAIHGTNVFASLKALFRDMLPSARAALGA